MSEVGVNKSFWDVTEFIVAFRNFVNAPGKSLNGRLVLLWLMWVAYVMGNMSVDPVDCFLSCLDYQPGI